MKFILFYFLLIISFDVAAQTTDRYYSDITLYSDKNILLALHYCSKANIGDSNWLQLKITNTSDKIMVLKDVNYSLNDEIQPEKGKPYIDYGRYGRGNQFDLMHIYYDLQDPSSHNISITLLPDSSISAWKYLTNYASVLLESTQEIESPICATFQVNVVYHIQNQEKKVKSEENPFCFEWIKSDKIPASVLVHRLKEIILKPHYRWVNSYVLNKLMTNADIVREISTNELIQGIIRRHNVMNDEENKVLLIELSNREAFPIKPLTDSYRERIKNNSGGISSELHYYWDNALLDDLLNSKLEWFRVANILELNSKYWRTDTLITQKVLNYFKKKLNFDAGDKIDTVDARAWSKAVKVLAISRDIEFINYIYPYLENEMEFAIEDWSKYRHVGSLDNSAKPDIVNVRVCDIALVALLRAYNQFEFSNIERGYSVKIKNEILDQETINQLKRSHISEDINLSLYEREIKLTLGIKLKLKAME